MTAKERTSNHISDKLPMNRNRRPRSIATIMLAVLSLAVMGISTWFVLTHRSKTGYSVWEEVSYRTNGELIRYTLERLEGHPSLEKFAHPILYAAQRHIEKPALAPRTLIDQMGKGQQSRVLPTQRYLVDGRPQPLTIGLTLKANRSPVPAPVTGPVHLVRDARELKSAAALARAGDTITLLPGTYQLSGRLQPKHDGTALAPIMVRADTPGSVIIKISSGTIHLDRAYWIFENLVVEGHCGTENGPCEHAFHVVGGARNVVIRNNIIRNFAAHIKVNGERGQFPDGGLLQFNTLVNDKAYGHGSLTPFDLVGASHWVVADNQVSHFVKHWGKNASYGVFMKGGGEGGRIERNLLVCTTDGNISHFGSRVGISLGGGLTDKPYCSVKDCIYEHKKGVVINNVIMNCNDFGIDNNRAIQSVIAHNTVINTYGIGIRGIPSDAMVYGNVVDGAINERRGGSLTSTHNLQRNAVDRLQAPYQFDFRWRDAPTPIPTHPLVNDDFCGMPRKANSLPGAFSDVSACNVSADATHLNP